MSLARMNPFRELQEIQNTMNRFFGDRVSRFWDEGDRGVGQTWAPPVEIYETDSNVVVVCEVPGFERDQVDISVNHGRLTISGERKFENIENRRYHETERWYGRFFRSFLIPASVNHEQIAASLKNGVLNITLPKKEEAKPRQIQVSAS